MTVTGDELKAAVKVLGLEQGEVLRQAARICKREGRSAPSAWTWDTVAGDDELVRLLRVWMFEQAAVEAGGTAAPAGQSAGGPPVGVQLPERLVDAAVRWLNVTAAVFGADLDDPAGVEPLDVDDPADEGHEGGAHPHPVYDSPEYHDGADRVDAGEHPEEVAVDVGAALDARGVQVDLDELVGTYIEQSATKRLADELGATPLDSEESPEQETAHANA